jgi:hypothetical protein
MKPLNFTKAKEDLIKCGQPQSHTHLQSAQARQNPKLQKSMSCQRMD